jgi:hypothetical protein
MNTQIGLPLTTPALLFPAISLLLLAYTNRLLTLAGLVLSLGLSLREVQISIDALALELEDIDDLRP